MRAQGDVRMEELKIPKLKGKELGAYLNNKLDEIADSVVSDPDLLLEFARRWDNGFKRYSLHNIILAWAQKPDFTLLAGFRQWNKKGRLIKKGSKAIRILAPIKKRIKDENYEDIYIIKGFMPVSVFDQSDTEGPEISVGCSDLIHGEVDFDEIVKKCPIPVVIKNLGLINGRTSGSMIWISPRDNETAMVATLLHEWSHIWLGHCEKPGVLYEDDNRSLQEIEAECCSYICSCFLGISNKKSKFYIGAFGGKEDEIKGRGRKIITVAERIIGCIIT